MHPADQYAVRVLKAGAAGYLTKESASDEVVAAIEKVLNGGRYVTVALAEKLIVDMSADREVRISSCRIVRFQVLRTDDRDGKEWQGNGRGTFGDGYQDSSARIGRGCLKLKFKSERGRGALCIVRAIDGLKRGLTQQGFSTGRIGQWVIFYLRVSSLSQM